MNERAPTNPDWPGKSPPAGEAGATPPARPAARPRVKPPDRSQRLWGVVEAEALIPADHPARAVWELTGKMNLAPFYEPIQAVDGVAGRSPWDPRVLVSVWIYALSRGISSAREIARRCAYEPPFQWLCGLARINYHTLSDFRTAHGAALEKLFVEVLGVLGAEGLVTLERVMHDGTKIKAYAAADSFRREQTVRAHLEDARREAQALEQSLTEEPARQVAAQKRAARERQERLERALEQLEQIRDSKSGPQAKREARVSETESVARIMKQPDGGYAPSINVQLSTDAANKIIIGTGVSQSANDSVELPGAVDRMERNTGQAPGKLGTDGGFISRENIISQAARGVDLYGPLPDHQPQLAGQMQRRGVAAEFYPEAFGYDAQQDTYGCPAGQTLKHEGQEQRPGVVHHKYRAQPEACQACRFKAQCCPQSAVQGRSITRAVEAPEVQQFRQKMQTPQAKEIYRQRGPVAEFPNAWIKAKLGIRQFRLCGLIKVGLEVLWAALTYNIQVWIRLCWRPALACRQQ